VKRFAALVAAVLMVVGALALRQARDDEEQADGPADAPRGIVCADDLEAVCDAAGVPVAGAQAAGRTADALVAAADTGALGGDAWLVTAAWAALVIDERARLGEAPLFEVAGEPLASSPVVLAVWADRADQLARRCGAATGWRCLAEQSGTTLDAGDRVRAAGPDVDTAIGLVVAASQAAGLFGRSDFASNDFDPAFQSLAGRLASGQAGDPLRRMRVEGPGQVTAAGTVQAGAANLASSFGTIVADPPAPALRADVVLVVPRGAEVPSSQRQDLADALRAAGWGAPADGPSDLPAGGVLAAIRTLWSQSR